MSKSKNAVPPQQKNRDKTGQRQRNDKGQFVPGNKNGGRPKLREEFKQFAQEKSLESIQVVYGIMTDVATSQRDRVSAARLIMEYGYGRPAAEYDRERLELDKRKAEAELKDKSNDSTIRIVMSDELRELAE